MSSDRALESLLAAWQQQTATGFRMVPAQLARRIRADARQSRRGFALGVLFLVSVFVLFGALLARQPDPIRRTAHLVELASMVFIAGQLAVQRRRVLDARFDVDRTTVPSVTSARAYLEARRQFHSGAWLWSRIAVLFPGPPIDIYAQVRSGIISSDAGLRSLLLWIALLAAVMFIVQRGVARRYERALRELEELERQSPVERFMAAHEQWRRD